MEHHRQSHSNLLHLTLLLLVTWCLLFDHVTGSPAVSLEKRDTRIKPRERYRFGYLYGKRSMDPVVTPSTSLFDLVTRRLIPKQELATLLLTDEDLRREVATVLDKNDDGFISLKDLL